MDYPKRKNPRLKQYDYSQPGYYFITICSCQKKTLFSHITSKQLSVNNRLTPVGEVLEEELNNLPLRFPGIVIDKYVIMPNHIHIILRIAVGDGKTAVPDIVRAYKSLAGRRCCKMLHTQTIFQSSFHDHVIRNQSDYERIWNYIDGNPMKWCDDCFFVDETQRIFP